MNMNDEIQKAYIQFPALALEIKQMFNEDQEMRMRDLQDPEGRHWDKSLDKRNTERVREIINEFGLLGVSKIGIEGANNIYLLIQHADHDVAFQLHCLELMQNMPEGEFERGNIAYLTDRTRVNQGLQQVYGTQWDQKDGEHVHQPIEDEEHVEDRRKQMGLCTMEESRKDMYEKYSF
jgi:hypothetical protein